jgi:hypothetical protein
MDQVAVKVTHPKRVSRPVPDGYQFALPKEAMYGRLGTLAIEAEAPLSWMYPTLLGMYAGTGINMLDPKPKTHPTLYALLIGPIGAGKSAVLDRGQRQLGLLDDDIQVQPNSDRGLVTLYRDLAGLSKGEQPSVPLPG